mgnify:CR=1 FL=1
MKRVILLSLSFYLISGSCLSFAQDFLDADYNFIDNAFEGITPVTDKQFDDTINRLTPQPVENTFWGRLKTFLFGRKYGVEPAPKGQDKEIDFGGEQKAIQDIKNGIYYIKLIVSIVGANGDVIPLGNYKIQQKKENEQNILVFSQGEKEYGYLKLRDFKDENPQNDNAVTYSRIDIINENIIRVVYSTVSATQCAYAKVYSE